MANFSREQMFVRKMRLISYCKTILPRPYESYQVDTQKKYMFFPVGRSENCMRQMWIIRVDTWQTGYEDDVPQVCIFYCQVLFSSTGYAYRTNVLLWRKRGDDKLLP